MKEIDRLNKTGTAEEKKEKLQNFLLQYSNGDMEKMATIFTKTANDKSNPTDMKNVELLLHQLVVSSKGMQKAFLKGGEREGMETLYKSAQTLQKKDPSSTVEKDYCKMVAQTPSRLFMNPGMKATAAKP
jgi:hypothetical protein